MNKEYKDPWIAALRSGKYEQGDRYLCRIDEDGPRYCCLGVLADINGDLTEETVYHHNLTYRGIPVKGSEPSCATFTGELIERYGLDQEVIGRFGPIRAISNLIDMNDGQEKSFDEIATWVEENL